jgi:hypothetical protein
LPDRKKYATLYLRSLSDRANERSFGDGDAYHDDGVLKIYPYGPG